MNKTKKKGKAIAIKDPSGANYQVYGHEMIDDAAISQMDMAMRLPVSVKGALMADAHSGYGLPIGGVLATYNAVVPYGVGMDIACRMRLSIYPFPPRFIDQKRDWLKEILIKNTRFGKAEFNENREHEVMEHPAFREIRFLRELKDKASEQLGSSGSGNHFVDMGYVEIVQKSDPLGQLEPGKYFAILSHSGSRNFGARIANHYTSVAREKLELPKGASHLAWLDLDDEDGQEYWKAMKLAGYYAAANHEIIHEKLTSALGEKPVASVENHHNFAWEEKLNDKESLIVHRKGATPAGKGDLGVIPGSMTSPGFIVEGKGNRASLNSASHGAGRVHSRTSAKKSFSRKDLDRVLQKHGVELIGGGLDEVPMAYKNIEAVMKCQDDLVSVIGKFYPKIVRMS